MQNLIFRMYQWSHDHHDKNPSHGNQVHVKGKDSFRNGLAVVKGTAQGEDPSKKYFMVQYDGEDPIIVAREDFYIVHV